MKNAVRWFPVAFAVCCTAYCLAAFAMGWPLTNVVWLGAANGFAGTAVHAIESQNEKPS